MDQQPLSLSKIRQTVLDRAVTELEEAYADGRPKRARVDKIPRRLPQKKTLTQMRAKWWFITAHFKGTRTGIQEIMMDCVDDPRIDSIMGQVEKGEYGARHFQGVIVTKEQLRGIPAKKLLSHYFEEWCGGNQDEFHIEAVLDRQGTMTYVTKKETRIEGPYEFGIKLKKLGQGRRSDLAVLSELVNEGSTMDDVRQHEGGPSAFVRYGGGLQKLRELVHTQSTRMIPDRKVHWFWGPTGTGKSHTAWLESEGKTCVALGSKGDKRPFYFGAYDYDDVVILDDLRPDDLYWGLLLRLLDKYPIKVDCRNADKQWVVKKIYVTSCLHPRDFSPAGEDGEQLLRRITDIRHFPNKFEPDVA